MARLAALGTWLGRIDEQIAALALGLMMLIPLIEIVMRPMMGSGISNAPVVVQHLGLVLAMFGALAAERHGHLTSFGSNDGSKRLTLAWRLTQLLAAAVCGMLAYASWQFVSTERDAAHTLAYGLPVWTLQACMPLCFVLLGFKLGARCAKGLPLEALVAAGIPGLGIAIAAQLEGTSFSPWPAFGLLAAALLAGAPIFTVLGGLALVLFWSEGMPLASVALSHYQITVNPSLPALPLFTLAGLLFARTGATQRLGDLFVSLFGGGVKGTVVAVALLCSFFTAFTGGSGVTILALGGLMLPLLSNAAYPEKKGIGLVTSASALGALLAPSVPLIMYDCGPRAYHHHVFSGRPTRAGHGDELIGFWWIFEIARVSDSRSPKSICRRPMESYVACQMGNISAGSGHRLTRKRIGDPHGKRGTHRSLCPDNPSLGPPGIVL